MERNIKILIGILGAAGITAAIVNYYKKKKSFSVKNFGAVGDGVTNDTAAIQKAIDQNSEVYLPKGNYLVDTLFLKNGSNIYGDGYKDSIMIHTGKNTATSGMLSVMSETEEKISNIKISNLSLDGQSDKEGFSEFKHLIYLIGVDGAIINNVFFRAFRGDGICLGGVTLGKSQPRHNYNVVVKNSKFDGAGKANRNGISIIDCTNFLVEKCKFIDCTQDNMPSAIDFEPDTSYNIVKNCTVTNCEFENVGGNLGVIGMNLGDHKFEQFPNNIVISNNKLNNCSNDNALTYQYGKIGGIAEDEAVIDLLWENNHISNCRAAFLLGNGNEVTIRKNEFVDCSRAALISYPNYEGLTTRNTILTDNEFIRVGEKSGSALILFNLDGLIIEKNKFIDCGSGKEAMDYAINFTRGESKNVIIRYNIFDSPTGKTKYSIMYDKNHIFNEDTNQFYDNKLNGLESYFKYKS